MAVVGLLAAVQEALPDLKSEEDGALLITNGAFGDLDPKIDEMAVNFKTMGLALANGAKHKLVGLLAQRLKSEGVHVAEVVVAGSIKGTAWDRGNATLEGADVAKEFWRLHQGRSEVSARVG